ncbi:phosphoglycolate phosphatase [Methanolobus halotolerans]|uniref:Phosphoglycolate phosphatase n=1 Tax=Methanolobus halotolerans TaxID=2052935 RepID=A0A4E0PZW1_9EURY|nr:phosphoglycolate phosphatase [Methanolobus halotolerans]TGC11183.1 phosphoglycolate phosphatase [Methanolobus halotolerans]
MTFKALAIDIDGTITNMDRRLSLKATEKLRELDVPVVLATGNILCYAKATAKLIGVCCNVIAENGGVVTDRFDKKPYISDVITECEQAFDILSREFDMEKLDSVHRRTEIVLRRDFDLERARALLNTTDLDVEIIDTHFAIHIKSKKINKGTGLVRIADMMGLKPSDFVAIGDSVNDMELLALAGYSVAVSNADDFLKDIADHVTRESYGEGTAEVIDYLVSKGMLNTRQ